MAQILDALGPVERGLGRCEPNPLQHRTNWDPQMWTDSLGKQSRLIETALPLPRRMQRDGNNRVELALAQSGITQRGHEPLSNQMPKMDLLAVFEIENDVTRDAATPIGRDSGVEVKFAMGAVGAGKRCSDRAVERLGAFGAKWRYDPRKFCFTISAQIFAQSNRC
jgi:hypothetical protein